MRPVRFGVPVSQSHLQPLPLSLTVVEVTCYEYDGILAVKEALRAGLAVSTERMPLKAREREHEAEVLGRGQPSLPLSQISLIAPPEYAISTVSLDKAKVGGFFRWLSRSQPLSSLFFLAGH